MGFGIVSKVDESGKEGSEVESSLSKSEVRLLQHHGAEGLIRIGLNAAAERVTKNRILAFTGVLLAGSVMANVILSTKDIQPQLLGETSDGRIRPLPLLSEPLYSHSDILDWSERCVKDIYNLSYVDWRESIQNNTFCLSDEGRSAFAQSLKKVGVLDHLTPDMQGIVYATTGAPVMRSATRSDKGYSVWVVDVPYTLTLNGRKRGRLESVMTMEVRRVSLTWRDSGLWVDRYEVNPAGGR